MRGPPDLPSRPGAGAGRTAGCALNGPSGPGLNGYGPTGNQTVLRARSKDWQTILRELPDPSDALSALTESPKRCLILPILKILGRFIVADSKVCHGQPTFRGTRVFVADVLDQVGRGLDWETIIEEWHGSITHEAIAEVVHLAAEEFQNHADDFVVVPTVS